MTNSTQRASSTGTLSPQCPHPVPPLRLQLPHPPRAPSELKFVFFPLKKKKAQDSPQWKHHLAMALGKLAASPGFPIPGFFPFLVFFPIETANSGDAGPGAGGFPGALQAPSLAQPSSPSPPYCSNSTRHGYKNKTAM